MRQNPRQTPTVILVPPALDSGLNDAFMLKRRGGASERGAWPKDGDGLTTPQYPTGLPVLVLDASPSTGAEAQEIT